MPADDASAEDGRGREAAPAAGPFTSLADSAWIGAGQSTEVIEQAAELHGPSGPARNGMGGLLFRPLSVTQATILLSVAFMGSALLGALRQVLFNAEFGAGAEASAYYAAFRLPDTLFSLIAGGALSSAMIPVLIGVRQQRGEAAARRLTNLVMTGIMAVFAVLVVAGMVLAPYFVRSILAPGFDEPTSRLATNLTRIMLLQPLLLAAGSVAIATLNSRNQFVLTALSVLSHNVALIGGILIARANPEIGIYGPAAGVVAGGLLQAVIVVPGLFAQGARPRFAWNPGDGDLRDVVRLLIPNGLVVGSGYAGFIIDTAFASVADDPGALPAVQNAWLLAGLPITLIGSAVGQAAFPRFAAQAARADWRRLRQTVALTVGVVVAMALPAVAGTLVLGRETIRVLFERGAFDAAAGTLTFELLQVYALALPAYMATEVITRGLIAMRDTRTPLLTNVAQQAGRALIIWVLIDVEGARAIPIAMAVTATVETGVLGAILSLKLRRRLRAAKLVAPAPA